MRAIALLLLMPLLLCGSEAEVALRKAVEFYRSQVAVEGTYLWQYSTDLSVREGEGKATLSQGWVQPPGTPAVGMAYLKAWEATKDIYYLQAARETASGLLKGQLQSGGWHYAIELNPELRRKIAYSKNGGPATARNVTTFDDDTTQAAVRFLMRLDKALDFDDAEISEAVNYALFSILKAQYPNGAWPQGYDKFPDQTTNSIKHASYPETWARTWPGSKQYWLQYTLNDNVLHSLVETLLEAELIYADKEIGKDCRKAAERVGDFLLSAQMPEPQPAWAQQYNYEMHPAWARKFEPPAITGAESQDAIRTLIALYKVTRQKRFIETIPRALEYLQNSRLPDGRLARFYELKTNKPLYFTKDYKLTYNDEDVPTHYSFKVQDKTEDLFKELGEIHIRQEAKPKAPNIEPIIKSQDKRGAWVENGKIRSSTFIRNVEFLSLYIQLTHNAKPQ